MPIAEHPIQLRTPDRTVAGTLGLDSWFLYPERFCARKRPLRNRQPAAAGRRQGQLLAVIVRDGYVFAGRQTGSWWSTLAGSNQRVMIMRCWV